MNDLSPPMIESLAFREEPEPSDLDWVRKIVESTDFFTREERDIALELVEERLTKGEKSGYLFLFAEGPQGVVGYSCFGPIMGTIASYDLYWLAVHDRCQGVGIGKILLGLSEKAIALRGGKRIYADTASRDQYAPTRAFYLACGYREEARLIDFYSPGDGKVIYVKAL
ncbi:MAG: GNAT family N-acetyltransferase [Smithellaceae bacterium]|nr:GNAT family N-acetyltransferase [Smithellaceae bacterium]